MSEVPEPIPGGDDYTLKRGGTTDIELELIDRCLSVTKLANDKDELIEIQCSREVKHGKPHKGRHETTLVGGKGFAWKVTW